VADAADPREVIAALPPDVDARARADAKQLDVVRAADMYLRSGRFMWPEVIGVWKSAVSDAMYDGRFNAVRGIEAWSGHEMVPDVDELLTLESEINRYLPILPQMIVCLYGIERFDGAVVNLLRTHRKVLVGGLLVTPWAMQPVRRRRSNGHSRPTTTPLSYRSSCSARARSWEQHTRRTAHPRVLSDALRLLGGQPEDEASSAPQALIEPLTDSEVRVLRYLPTNFSAVEMARAVPLGPHRAHPYPAPVAAPRGVVGLAARL
jgi:hypothetical protein